MGNKDNLTEEQKNYYIPIIITQSICVILIALCLVCIKYFFKDIYKETKKFYINELCSQTDIKEVIEDSGVNL